LLHDSVGILITFAAAGAGADALPFVVAVGDESGEAPPGCCRSAAAATTAVASQISASVMIIIVSRPPPAARTSAATAIFPIAHFPAAPSATAANNSRQTHERPYEPMFRTVTRQQLADESSFLLLQLLLVHHVARDQEPRAGVLHSR
jgi:hypothetical protein